MKSVAYCQQNLVQVQKVASSDLQNKGAARVINCKTFVTLNKHKFEKFGRHRHECFGFSEIVSTLS